MSLALGDRNSKISGSEGKPPRPSIKQKKIFPIFNYLSYHYHHYHYITIVISCISNTLLFWRSLVSLSSASMFKNTSEVHPSHLEMLLPRDKSKQWRSTSRIITMAIVTAIILSYNYDESCAVLHINYMSFMNCFYLNFKVSQVVQVIVANSILFALHIYEKFIRNGLPDMSRYNIKGVFIVILSICRLQFWRNYYFEPAFIERQEIRAAYLQCLSFSPSVSIFSPRPPSQTNKENFDR